jgi:asparagine synthase (glutamine-hydrolysing)
LLAMGPLCDPIIEGVARRVLGGEHRAGARRDLARRASALLGCPTQDALYDHIRQHWHNAAAIVGADPPSGDPMAVPARPYGLWEYMAWRDSTEYLPDDILCKVDRASMAVSLECRVPLLDHRVVETAARLPGSMKVAGDARKRVLRSIAHRHLPSEALAGPKRGFGIPLGTWLRTDLHDWARGLIESETLIKDGIFAADPVRHYWHQHCNGDGEWHHFLWDVLAFQAWLEPRRDRLTWDAREFSHP